MKTMTRIVWLYAGIGLLAAPTANAQVTSPAPEKIYVNVNVGGQFAKRTLNSKASITKYEEPATLDAAQEIGAGLLFDVAAGYRIHGDIYAGLAISLFRNTSDANYTASIPDPVVFNRFKTVTGQETSLDREELGFHPNVTWARTLTDKVDVAVGIGASFIRLKQRLINSFVVPDGTQSVIPLLSDESAVAKGVYVQADFIYNLKPRYGVGGFVRYAGGKVDLPSASDQSVGGPQAGVGIRLRF